MAVKSTEGSDSLPTALPLPELPELIQRYLNGESMIRLAKDARVARRTLYRWMHSALGDKEYHEAVTDAMLARMADADDSLSKARDTWQVARAREEAKFARWDLERRRPELFGQKSEVKENKTLHVIVDRRPQPVVIDGQSGVSSVPSSPIHSGSSEWSPVNQSVSEEPHASSANHEDASGAKPPGVCSAGGMAD